MLLAELPHLLRLQAGVSEHADLVGDMRPVMLGAELLKIVTEGRAHRDDAVGHILNLALPLLVESRVVKNLRSDASTVDRGVGVHRSDDDLELRLETGSLFGVLADNGEDTSTLTVKTLKTVSEIMRKAEENKLTMFLAND